MRNRRRIRTPWRPPSLFEVLLVLAEALATGWLLGYAAWVLFKRLFA